MGDLFWRLARSHCEGRFNLSVGSSDKHNPVDRSSASSSSSSSKSRRDLCPSFALFQMRHLASQVGIWAWTGSGKRRKVNLLRKRLHLRCGETIDKQLAWPVCRNLLTCMKLLSWRWFTISWFHCIEQGWEFCLQISNELPLQSQNIWTLYKSLFCQNFPCQMLIVRDKSKTVRQVFDA